MTNRVIIIVLQVSKWDFFCRTEPSPVLPPPWLKCDGGDGERAGLNERREEGDRKKTTTVHTQYGTTIITESRLMLMTIWTVLEFAEREFKACCALSQSATGVFISCLVLWLRWPLWEMRGLKEEEEEEEEGPSQASEVLYYVLYRYTMYIGTVQ